MIGLEKPRSRGAFFFSYERRLESGARDSVGLKKCLSLRGRLEAYEATALALRRIKMRRWNVLVLGPTLKSTSR
jgi:hypothetical protein